MTQVWWVIVHITSTSNTLVQTVMLHCLWSHEPHKEAPHSIIPTKLSGSPLSPKKQQALPSCDSVSLIYPTFHPGFYTAVKWWPHTKITYTRIRNWSVRLLLPSWELARGLPVQQHAYRHQLFEWTCQTLAIYQKWFSPSSGVVMHNENDKKGRQKLHRPPMMLRQ